MSKLCVAVGNDHAGYASKGVVIETLSQLGFEVDYCGSDGDHEVDFPDISKAVCAKVVSGSAHRAVLVCGTGVGASMAANRIAGIRAFVGHDLYSARQGVEHDDANVLCVGHWIIGPELMRLAVSTFMAARFSPEEHFRRRVEKLNAMRPLA